VCRRINDISNKIIIKWPDQIRDFNYFSLEFYESINISEKTQLVVFVHEVNESFQVTEEMLYFTSLKDSLKREDIFNTVGNCLCEPT